MGSIYMDSYKSVALVEVPEPRHYKSKFLTHDELIQQFKKRKALEKQTVNDLSIGEEFWNDIDLAMYQFTQDIKESYYFRGFLDDVDFHKITNIFKNNTILREVDDEIDNEERWSDYEDQ